MALGWYMIMFVAMSTISILGLLLLFLVKSPGVKRVLFYAMAVWGMAVSAGYATSLPSNWIAAQISGWGLGFFSVAGIVVYIKAKNDRQRQIAGILVAVSVVGAILKLFVL